MGFQRNVVKSSSFGLYLKEKHSQFHMHLKAQLKPEKRKLLSMNLLSLLKMKTVVVFFVASVCIQSATPSKLDVRKKRAWIVDSLTMEEEHAGPFPYKLGDLNIEKKVLEEYSIHGQGIDKDPKGILSVSRNGSVYAHGKVDFEEYRKLRITLSKKQTAVAVDIDVLDINDHAPVFNRDLYEIAADESTQPGKALVTVLAADNDQPGTANAHFTLRISSVSPSPSGADFFIQQRKGEQTGSISFKGYLDYEKTQKYTILVEAKDHGEKIQLSSTSTVILNIMAKHGYPSEFTRKTKHASDSSALKKMKQVGVLESGPMLETNKLSMCLSEETTDVTALNPALYSPPLRFQLIGDVQGKWRLRSDYGASVRLIKDGGVHAGHHRLTFKISDSQGQSSVQTLSLLVCDCDASADCKDPAAKMNVAGVALTILGIPGLLGILLMVCCKIRAKQSEKRNKLLVEASEQFLSPDTIEAR
ncbi:protocadherin Fat 2-like isoform X2 [Puntigrus tetrazona]|uniref:protocadherin Fat 2-like isoform X2 n=1 Tax=Puntigrus tetrazona TaxID=1606681 RepID=UPI001C8A1C4A|nr:protocadherin Fat 2-like isoform X2 [Puntigrus tetrazona]